MNLGLSNNIIEEENDSFYEMDFDLNKFNQAVVWGTDWTTETIFNQLKKGNIDLNPSFQRRDAWSDAEKSRLIESLMLGLPVPPIILAENKKKKNSYIVIDGKQRLLSIRRFFEENDDGAFKPLKLRSLDILKELNGNTINQARAEHSEYVTNIENQSIRTIVIKNWPDEPFLYTVFLRLNTGSKKLSPQELRQALKPGSFLDYLDDATAESSSILRMLNNKTADPRMKDIEITLRFYAFHCFFKEYSGNLKEFLDMTCEKLNNAWGEKSTEIKNLFARLESAIDFSYEITDSNSPFSRYIDGECVGRFNRAIFELFSFYFVHEDIKTMVKNSKDEFMDLFIAMNNDSDFISSISGSTKDVNNMHLRFQKFYTLLTSLESYKQTDIAIPKVELKDGKFNVLNSLS